MESNIRLEKQLDQRVDRPMHPKVAERLRERDLKRQYDAAVPIGKKTLMLAMALGLGVLFDRFFVEPYWGISVFIFAVLFIGAVHIAAPQKQKSRMSYVFLAAVLLLSATYGIFNNQALKALNSLALPMVFTAYVLSVRYPAWDAINVSYLLKIFDKLYIKAAANMYKVFPFVMEALKEKKQFKESSAIRQILLGLALGVPLMLVVMIQLSAADAVFSKMVDHALKALSIAENILGHSIVMILATLYIFGYLWSTSYDDPHYKERMEYKQILEPMTVITIMSLLCSVFLIFTVIQFSYLYAGVGALPDGLTYAQYARKGFFELLQVTCINIVVIVAGVLFTKENHVKLNQVGRIIYFVMTLFTMNLLVSSFYRMHLYEQAYGFTELRLFVQFFIGFLAISLVALLIWIWKPLFPMFKVGVVAAIGVYLVLNFINVDAVIAQKNLERFEETQSIDAYHIRCLSVDAYPAIWAAHQENPSFVLDDFMEYHEYEMDQNRQWFEFNYFILKYQNSNIE